MIRKRRFKRKYRENTTDFKQILDDIYYELSNKSCRRRTDFSDIKIDSVSGDTVKGSFALKPLSKYWQLFLAKDNLWFDFEYTNKKGVDWDYGENSNHTGNLRDNIITKIENDTRFYELFDDVIYDISPDIEIECRYLLKKNALCA